ncbi:MAG TPA: hypothetical protein VLA99_11590, partial [Nitrospiraceae bacterium]|nr:hypothetical protein [Nitrospiraceae bacterium]
GTTTVIQLMAPAGQGKTVLLEETALQFARSYTPEIYPTPMLLTVDLLGRYVGTVDDAIAGSLNNTYTFPGLTQRDVVQCIRRRWLILALDGFDELVARVGVRDSFQRITELLDQLRGAGTIILSARESFFELFQITAAIRSYLQPKQGSYTTTEIRLLPWNTTQGEAVFQSLGSIDPKTDLKALMQTFDGDTDIVLHPFFLTRLANLWTKGERFQAVGKEPDTLARTKYVIETFIDRESREKWVDRDGNALLDAEGHTTMLGTIAEEMWRSGAFRLGDEELKVAAELGLAELSLPRTSIDQILARVPTHAAFLSRDRGYSFLHDKFLHYFLGHRIAILLKMKDKHALINIFAPKELNPTAVEWIVWNWKKVSWGHEKLIEYINALHRDFSDATASANIAQICGKVIRNYTSTQSIELNKYSFLGDIFTGATIQNVHFYHCDFWHLDLTRTRLHICEFKNCRFGDILTDPETIMDGTVFSECEIARIETKDGSISFSPDDIDSTLEGLGAKIHQPPQAQEYKPPVPCIQKEVLRSIHKFVKASEHTCDVAIQDIEEQCGTTAPQVAKLGLRRRIFREVTRPTSGPKKTFVRFQVDRDKLLRGQAEVTGDSSIDEFWKDIQKQYARR